MCTGIRLIAHDKSVIHARSMEFGQDLESRVIVIPRGFARQGTAPASNDQVGTVPGAKWTTKFASVGANAKKMNWLFDGLNEKGLAVGTFYFPTFAKYPSFNKAEKTIAPWEVGSWLLDQFSTVDEVKRGIGQIDVAASIQPDLEFCPPCHYVVHDASGQSIVIEYVNSALQVHDNPIGVVTNSPPFDWHLINLRNYLNCVDTNLPNRTLRGSSSSLVLEPLGQGTGMLGLPGDFTPPSRFVRAVAFTQAMLPSLLKTGDDAVLQAFHILNNFDIPKGCVRDAQKNEDGSVISVSDYTLWTSANDLAAKKFYFRTYENSQIRVVDLKQMKLDAKDVISFNMYDKTEEIRSPPAVQS